MPLKISELGTVTVKFILKPGKWEPTQYSHYLQSPLFARLASFSRF